MKTHPLAASLLCLLVAGSALADSPWPSKPVRLVMPFSAGGPGDINSRMFADGLHKVLSQTMLIDNRAGAGGLIGMDAAAKSPPDGYTFLLSGNGYVTIPLLRAKMPYAESDLMPVAQTYTTPSILVVNAASGLKSLKDLQAMAKKGGKGITFGDAGAGSTGHFVAEMLQEAIGVPVTIVHYKSGSETVNSLLGSQIDVTSESALAVGPFIKTGKLMPIGVASQQRSHVFPDVPTTVEQGFPQVQMQHWGGYFAPKGTPPAILDRMNAAIQATAKMPDVRARQEAVGYESKVGTREDFERFIEAEKQRLGKIVRQANMSIE